MAPLTAREPRVEVPLVPVAAQKQYRCDSGDAFDARFGDGSVELVFASRGAEQLLRDAGGTLPSHTVYSSTKLKAEFGLDPSGRGAKLNFASPPIETRCVRD